jgi:CRISPR-associated protein Csh2
MKNQTISRSKVGQEPRLYVRVEYSTPGYHVGDLHNDIEVDTDRSKTDAELRSVRDTCLDVTHLVETLERVTADDHVETVHTVGSHRLAVSVGEDRHTAADLPEILRERDVPVHEIDVYEEFESTLPDEE